MSRRKKPKPFRAVKAVKALSRAKLGATPPTRRVENPKKSAQQKHKPTLRNLLQDQEEV